MLIFLVFIIVLFLIGSVFSSGAKDAKNMLNDSANYLKNATEELEKNKILDTDTEEEKAIKQKNSQSVVNDLIVRTTIYIVVALGLLFAYFWYF